MNRRRLLVLALGAALTGNPALLRAQTPSGSMRRVGVLAPSTRAKEEIILKPFFDQMRQLFCYGASLADYLGRLVLLVDKILKGAKPADIPVEQPTLFELVVNLKTAKAPGITIPRSILLRADRVIE